MCESFGLFINVELFLPRWFVGFIFVVVVLLVNASTITMARYPTFKSHRANTTGVKQKHKQTKSCRDEPVTDETFENAVRECRQTQCDYPHPHI